MQYDWGKLVTFILEELFFSQSQLADYCKVTQQSISNYKKQIRNPGPYAGKQLIKILTDADISTDVFTIDYFPAKVHLRDKSLKELVEIYNEMSSIQKGVLLEFVRFELCSKEKAEN